MVEVKIVHSNLAMDTLPRLGDLHCVAKDQPRHYSLCGPASRTT